MPGDAWYPRASPPVPLDLVLASLLHLDCIGHIAVVKFTGSVGRSIALRVPSSATVRPARGTTHDDADPGN
jgi:hypothetical protein